jgi:UDP-glucose 4-epimerase
MKYLLLGGAGFIGQHLSRELLQNDNNKVWVIDNLSTAKYDRSEFDCYQLRYKFSKRDLVTINTEHLSSAVEWADVIYHLAGSVGVEHIDKNPSSTLYNNFGILQKIVPIIKTYNKHIVFASTSEVYGDKPSGTFKETDPAVIGNPSKLRWGYASVKLTTEFLITASGSPYSIVRFFNVVGPGQLDEYGMVLPKFVKAAKENKPLNVYGDGNQVRCFCHINDAVNILKNIYQHPSGIYNIGNDSPVTINQLASTVIDVTKSQSVINHIPYKNVFSEHHGDILRRVPNIDKITQLGYNINYNLENIIRDMI